MWAWDDEPGVRFPGYYKKTDENSERPYLINNKNKWPDYYKNIAPRVEEVDDTPKQSDDTPKHSERKVKSVKTYTIKLTEYEDGGIDLNRVCEGFSYFEFIGVLKKVSELVERDFDAGKK